MQFTAMARVYIQWEAQLKVWIWDAAWASYLNLDKPQSPHLLLQWLKKKKNKTHVYAKQEVQYQEFKNLAIILPCWILYSTEHTQLKTPRSKFFRLELEKDNPSQIPNAHREVFLKLEMNLSRGTKTPGMHSTNLY